MLAKEVRQLPPAFTAIHCVCLFTDASVNTHLSCQLTPPVDRFGPRRSLSLCARCRSRRRPSSTISTRMICEHSLILLSWPRIARPFVIDILSRILSLVPFCLVPEFRVSSLLTRSPYRPFFPPSLARSYWIPLYLLLLNILSAVSPTFRPSLSCDPGSSQALSMALLPSSLVHQQKNPKFL